MPYEMTIQVLTTGNWSNDNQTTSSVIPPSLKLGMDLFNDFYMKKFSCAGQGRSEKKFG